MKKYAIFYFALFVAFLIIVLPQCKKATIPPARLNIILYDKPLDTIKSYVSGKWKLEYTYGGYVANLRSNYHDKDYIWQMDNGSRIKQWYLGHLITDTTIEWYKYAFGNGDEIFVMKFYEKRMYPYNYFVIGIVEDSLVIEDFGSDPASYHFSKQN